MPPMTPPGASPSRLAITLLAAGLLALARLTTVTTGAVSVEEQSPTPTPLVPSLSLTVSDPGITPGETLTMAAQVSNPGGGPGADFYLVLVLPDGSTAVSAGPGIGAWFGRFSDLRSLVPVASGIGLGAAFEYRNDAFFSHTFTGTEPLGLYRVYFAALRAGALGDGAIGAGELLALATAEFTVAAGVTTVVDPARRATVQVPPAGGTVTATHADGTTFGLVVPSGAVAAPTTISLTPILSAANLPNDGTFAMGVRAEPSGLQFAVPASLTVTLPEGTTPDPAGHVALVVSNGGRDVQVAPVLAGDTSVTVRVPHFSDVILVNSVFSLCVEAQTAEMLVACRTLFAAYQLSGDFRDPAFRSIAVEALREWYETGIGVRLQQLVTETVPPSTNPDALLDIVYQEWLAWAAIYEQTWGLLLMSVPTRPLSDLISEAYPSLAAATVKGQERANARCLADKPTVAAQVERVATLTVMWTTVFGDPDLLDPQYCLGLEIDAAPPPVLVPGQPSQMPVSIVARFTDGVDLPGVEALVTITATNAMVSPAGGVVRLPVSGPVTLTPEGTSSLVTIRGEFAEGALALIPEEIVTLPAGGTLRVVESLTLAAVVATLPTRPEVEEVDLEDVYAPTQSVAAILDESVTIDDVTIRARSSSAAQRTVSGAANDVTITGSFRVQPVLTVEGSGSGGSATTIARSEQSVCFELPAPYLATFSVQGNGNPGSNVQLTLESGDVRGGGGVGDSGSLVLPADERACVSFEVRAWSCDIVVQTPTCDSPNPLTASYTVRLQRQ